jgi:hypothetical protein
MLAVAALLIAFGTAPALAAVAPVGDTSQPAVLPAGATEERVLRLLFPDYDERARRSKAGEGQSPNEEIFSVAVNAVVETDFGFGGDRFLIATASGMAGQCSQCRIGRGAVLDFSATRVVFRFPVAVSGESIEDAPRLFHINEGQETLAVALTTFSGSLGGLTWVDESWYVPLRKSEGSIQFEKVWRGQVEAATGGNRGVSGYRACGAMLRLDGAWYYVLSTYYGDELESEESDGIGPSSPSNLFAQGWGIDGEPSIMGEVEIRCVQPFSRTPGSARLKGGEPVTKRIDHHSSELFPLSLPVRAGAWLRMNSRPDGSPKGGVNGASAPSRDLVAEVTPPSEYAHDNLVIRRLKGGVLLRTIRLHHGDAFYGLVRAIGWSRDESRAFVVITFGNSHTALLSFSVEGSDDYWEGLVDPDAGWRDGFVMEPAKGGHR